MLRAYAAGIFPMSEGADDPTLFWVDPQRRGVFPLDGFHVSRSLRRRMRKDDFEVRVNSDFLGTVEGCAAREPTWINAEIFRCYMSLHAMGRAHSVEVWENGELSGGVFGIVLGGAFFGESMFSRRKDASKIALDLADRASELRWLSPVRHAVRDGASGNAGCGGTAPAGLSRPAVRRA
jgi:leucyl/phenylalanyl-tRNA--protein transferase